MHKKEPTIELIEVPIVKIISEHRRPRNPRPAAGFKRVEDIVRIGRREYTRHCDTKDGRKGVIKFKRYD